MDKFRNKYRTSSTRRQNWDYTRNGAYFVTICTQNREHFFGDINNEKMILSETGKIADKYWLEIPQHFPFVILDAHVVMPNHVHGIVIIDKTGVDRAMDMAVETGRSETSENTTIETSNLGNKNVETPKLVNKNVETPKLDVSTPSPPTTPPPQTAAATEKWQSGSLGVIINQYKRICTIHARKINAGFAWQPRYYDHIIRNDASWQRIKNYIIKNPENWNRDKFYM